MCLFFLVYLCNDLLVVVGSLFLGWFTGDGTVIPGVSGADWGVRPEKTIFRLGYICLWHHDWFVLLSCYLHLCLFASRIFSCLFCCCCYSRFVLFCFAGWFVCLFVNFFWLILFVCLFRNADLLICIYECAILLKNMRIYYSPVLVQINNKYAPPKRKSYLRSMMTQP